MAELLAPSLEFDAFPSTVRIGVALDGSAVATKALKTAAYLVNKDRGDKLYLLHVTNAQTRASMPAHLQPSYLESKYLAEASAAPYLLDATWYCRDRGDKQTLPVLTNLAEELQLDFLIVGSYGKSHADDGHITVMGTVCEGSLRSSTCSVIVVKSTSWEVEPSEGLTYAVTTDNSPAAQASFMWVAHMLAKPGKDKVYILYTSELVSLTTMLGPYLAVLESLGIEGHQIFDHNSSSDPASTRLLKLATEVQADFVCTGISGFSEKKLGSVSEALCKDARCSCLCVKAPEEAQTKAED